VQQPVDQEAMMRGAIRGMLETLDDPHTSYLDPDMFERANAELEGAEYQGIGAWVDITGDFLTIISPMPGSPAEEAGLLPGDKVIAVDGDDMAGIDGELVRQRIVGPKNTVVRLTIQREGVEPFEVSVERDVIVVPSVTSKMLEGDIGYVQLFNFGSDTSDELHDQLKDLMRQDPKGMILDLRFNGGGYLHTAIEVASEFIGEGVVMYEEYGDGTRKTYEASRG
jgi:carboxyl-terminal processing protease